MLWLGKINRNVAWAAIFLLAAGCGGSNETQHQGGYLGPVQFQHRHQGDYPIKVVTTTGMVADLVANIGGSHVAIQQIMGEGVDPHLYKASPGDVSMLSSAAIIFYNGRNLEGKMGDIFARMTKQKPTVPVGQHIEDQFILESEGGHPDPHLWFDVSLWSKAAGAVRDALKLYDPSNAAEYQKNADAYMAKLATLHEWVKAEVATIPKEQRVMVTAHDAFRYFGRAYDIEVKGIQGISTEDEASVKAINDLVQFLANRKIKAVFVESSVSEKNLKALIEGADKGRGHKVEIGGELFSDAMGKAGTPEGTYEGMIRHNVNTIVKALK